MTRANGSSIRYFCKIWDRVGDKNDSGVIIGCETIVLRRGYKK